MELQSYNKRGVVHMYIEPIEPIPFAISVHIYMSDTMVAEIRKAQRNHPSL